MMREAGPMARKLQADVIVEAAARQIRELLKEAVARLEPFPPFPGSFFTLGIEVEGGMAEGPERGCVIVGPDGELHEMEVSIDYSQGQIDPVAARDERLKPLDLHPRDYLVYAYNALTRITELLLEQDAPGES